MVKVSKEDYPLYTKRPELIRSLTGKSLNEITLDGVLSGEVVNRDGRMSPYTLEMQAQVAEDAGRRLVASNFRRAAELCIVPDEKVMAIYEALRPNRCTAAEMEAIASDLEDNYQAKLNAALVREAAQAYAERGFLRIE